MTEAGLQLVLQLLSTCKPGALVWLGVPCSSWVWMGWSNSGRNSWNPSGNQQKPYTKVPLLCSLLQAYIACSRLYPKIIYVHDSNHKEKNISSTTIYWQNVQRTLLHMLSLWGWILSLSNRWAHCFLIMIQWELSYGNVKLYGCPSQCMASEVPAEKGWRFGARHPGWNLFQLMRHGLAVHLPATSVHINLYLPVTGIHISIYLLVIGIHISIYLPVTGMHITIFFSSMLKHVFQVTESHPPCIWLAM